MPSSVSFCGHRLSPEEFQLIRDIVHDFPSLSLSELSKTICELLDWRRPTGALKNHECYVLLRQLQDRGLLSSLPAIRTTSPRGPREVVLNDQSNPQTPVTGTVGEFLPLELSLVTNSADRALFKQYIARYHYLGYRVPFGAQLRYSVRSHKAPELILACLLFSSAAWRMAPRDRWIGWSDAARRSNLSRVVNHSRFLILPWIHIRELASKVLSLAAQRITKDWFCCYQVQPLLLETLVDPTRFPGTCYRAANWIHVGTTQGRGRMDRYHDVAPHPKDIFLYPLVARSREQLCQISSSPPLPGNQL
jgi:Domain of unknown function (DUF4338)